MEYTYTLISKIKTVQKIKYSKLTWLTKEIKNYIFQLGTNWKTKLKQGAKCGIKQ